MTTLDDSAPVRNATTGGRRRFLKACGVSALAIGATPAVASCGLLGQGKTLFEVDAADWLARLAVQIGAGTINRVTNGGLAGLWAEWGPEVEAVGENILEYGVVAASDPSGGPDPSSVFLTSDDSRRYHYIPDRIGFAHPVPPMVMMRASLVPHGDPHTDLLYVFVDQGRKHIVLKPWAWQTLAHFVNYLTANQDPANLSVARAVCVLTLVPSGLKPRTGRIPGGLVDFYNYKSRNGNVKIALVQESNGGPTGVITASAIPGGDGLPLVKHFTLPRQPPGTV